jgi:MFS family permease
MRSLLIPLTALLAAVLLLISGNAFLMTLLGVRLNREGFDPAVIGWVQFCYSAGFVVGTLYANRVITQVGHIRAFAVFAATAACAALLHPLWVQTLWWSLLRLLSGVAMAGLLITIESWISSRATSENRGVLFASYLVAFYLATAGGQLLMNLGDPLSFKLFSLVALLLTLALIPVALTRLAAPPLEQLQHVPLRELLQRAPLAFGTAMISGVVISAFYAIGPVYAELRGLSLAGLSAFMAISVLAAMLFAWPVGLLCDRFERRTVLMWLALGAALGSIVTAIGGAFGLAPLLFGSALFMGLAAALYPVGVAILNDRIDSHQIVAASAGLLLAYGIGACLGPLLSAQLVSGFGAAALFLGNAVALLLLALLARYWIAHVRPVPVAAQEHYIPTAPATSPVITELDPRNPNPPGTSGE